MATLELGKELITRENLITFDVNPEAPLPKGAYVFQLVVVDDDGLRSDPMQVTVVVADDRAPTAVLRAPSTVQLGRSFTLDGSASTDPAPGRVVQYVWTWLR